MKPLNFIRSLSLLTIISLITFSCLYDNEEELYPADPDNPVICDTVSLTYDGQIATILNTNCAVSGCHDGSVSPNLSDFGRVSNRLGQIENRAITRGDMPPSSRTPLNDCDKQKLATWISNGGPKD